MTAVNIFMDSYQKVYNQGMAAELRRRYPKISKQLDFLWKRKDITTTDPAKLTPEDIREYVKYQRMRARTNQAHPDVGNPGVNFCASMPTVACVCNPESIAKISRRCLTCSAITALDRQLLTYQLMAHPDTEAVE